MNLEPILPSTILLTAMHNPGASLLKKYLISLSTRGNVEADSSGSLLPLVDFDAQQEAIRQQAIQAQQQQQYEATLTRRQQEYGTIINGPQGFYTAVAKTTTPEHYDRLVQQYASLLPSTSEVNLRNPT